MTFQGFQSCPVHFQGFQGFQGPVYTLEETFRTFGTKMLRKKPNLMQLKQLKRVGVDMEAAKIFFQPQDHHYHVDLKNFFGD